MANSYLTPQMNLVIPVPGLDQGPDWASNLNSSLTLIDSHDHSSSHGSQVTPSGLTINADLTFQNTSNATNLRSVRFTSQSGLLPGASFIGTLYESGDDLYFNDALGNQVRITQSGAVAGAAGTITGLPSNTASASFSASTGTFIWQQATSIGANFDVASIAIRYPGSYPSPTGNYIQLQAPAAIATGYSLDLPSVPLTNNHFLTISTAGVISSSVAVDSATVEISSNTLQIKNGGITLVKKAAANIQFSGTPAGNFSTPSSTFVAVTNVTLSLTTIGRPVMILGYSAATGADVGSIEATAAAASSGAMYIRLLRDGVQVGITAISVSINAVSNYLISMPAGALKWIDAPAAGSHVYTIEIRGNGASTATWNTGVYIAAYEF